MNGKIIFEKLDDDKMICPVCGNIVETYDVCDICNWENTGHKNIDGGPNTMTLEEAKIAYRSGIKIV